MTDEALNQADMPISEGWAHDADVQVKLAEAEQWALDRNTPAEARLNMFMPMQCDLHSLGKAASQEVIHSVMRLTAMTWGEAIASGDCVELATVPGKFWVTLSPSYRGIVARDGQVMLFLVLCRCPH